MVRVNVRKEARARVHGGKGEIRCSARSRGRFRAWDRIRTRVRARPLSSPKLLCLSLLLPWYPPPPGRVQFLGATGLPGV